MVYLVVKTANFWDVRCTFFGGSPRLARRAKTAGVPPPPRPNTARAPRRCTCPSWRVLPHNTTKMPVDQQKALLYGGAAALRLLLSTVFPALPTLLAGRVEVSTPVTSFKRCKYLLSPLEMEAEDERNSDMLTRCIVQEGLFLYTHNVSPYDGGLYHQAPLLLPLFSLLPNPSYYPIATDIVFTLVDLLGAYALAQIAESGTAAVSRLFSSTRKELRWSSAAVAAG